MIAVFSLWTPFPVAENQTVMYMLLIMISMAAVIKSCWPFNPLRAFLCITMVGGTFFALHILPSLFEVSGLTSSMGIYILAGIIVCLIMIVILDLARRRIVRLPAFQRKTGQ